MDFIPQAIPDVVLIKPTVFGDERGFFMETFRDELFKEKCGGYSFVQDNHSSSTCGILRGLHYQTHQPQGKLVRVISGEVFDVAVDLRKSSPSFGKWIGVILSASNKNMLWVPPGFAHGFYVLSEHAEFVYKCTDYYSPEHEVSLQWNDPTLNINWPIVDKAAPILSAKDNKACSFSQAPYYD